jgi:hypothetical protein
MKRTTRIVFLASASNPAWRTTASERTQENALALSAASASSA